MKSKQNSGPLPNPRKLFLKWYQSSNPGQTLAKNQASYLSSSLKHTFYRRVLQVGRLGSEEHYTQNGLQHCFMMIESELEAENENVHRIIGQFNEMPIDSDSIDLLIIPHVLEFAQEPAQVLSEACRILKPEGRLIILCFNPWSMLGLKNYFSSYFPQQNSIGIDRLFNWLNLLELESKFDTGFSLSSESTKIENHFLIKKSMNYFADAYAVQAIKRVQQPIVIKPVWTNLPGLLPEQAINNFRCGKMHE